MYRFNIYSWTLFIIYVALVFFMETFSPRISLENIYSTVPLIGGLIFWSERLTPLIRMSDSYITKEEAFYRDFFLITYGVLSGHMLYSVFQYNNSDARGWWPLVIYFITAIGIVFAIFYSLFAMILNSHKKYTFGFSFVLIILLMFISSMEHLYPMSFFANSKAYFICLLLLIGMHSLLCLGYKVLITQSSRCK
jgi:hypothetical protein